MNNIESDALGVDIGGVIIARIHAGGDTSFHPSHFLKTPLVDGAIDALADLVSRRFGARVHLVSKCGPKVEHMTRAWLETHRFFERTGIAFDNLHFCRERRDKAPICTQLGITHFIDDRLEVLSCLNKVPHLYLFQPDDREVAKFAAHLCKVRRVDSWGEICAMLL